MRKFYVGLVSIFMVIGFITDTNAQCGTTPITGDLIISSNTPLSGTYNISGIFRVDAGVTVTVDSYASNGCGELVINASQIDVIGDIIADGAGFPGGSGGAGSSTGSNLGGLTGCVDKDNCHIIQVNGGAAGAAGSGPGAGTSGVGGTLGRGPKQECQNFGDEYGFVGGSGGAGGSAGGSYGAAALGGGTGGNGGAYSSGNFSGMNLSGCTSPLSGTGGGGGTSGAAYGTNNGTDIDLGSGGAGAGGGGKSNGNGGVGSAGGNGGGLIALYSTGSMQVLGNLSVNGTVGGAGGSGGNGGTTSDCCSDGCNDCGERTFSSGAGGGGGSGGGSGGGILLESYGAAVITGTLRAAGGNGGTGGTNGSGTGGCSYNVLFCGSNAGSTGAGTSGALGGGGSGGRVKIFKNPCQTNNINASVLIGGGNGNGGQSNDGTFFTGDIGNIVAPTLSSTVDSVSCFGLSDGEATVTVAGGTAPFTYSWSPAGGSAATATGLEAGSYDVTVVDSNSCMVTTTVVIPEPDTLTTQVFGTIDADCYAASTGEASATGLGGTAPYSYVWDDPNSQITATATGLPAGTWNVTVTDFNGCTSSGSATLGQPQPFAASLTIDQDVSCNGQADGQATVFASGLNLSYQWDDPASQTTATATGLPAGAWTCTVSSSQTCDTVITVVIDEPAVLTLLAVENQAVSCNGGSDGIALVTQLGGTGPFSYQWDDSNLQTTPSATGLSAGTYNVVVTDDNGCAETASVAITEPSSISISVNISGADCFGQASASIEAVVTGGTGPYTYDWTPGNLSGQIISNIAAGSYELTVTDDNGCTETFSNILVQQPTELTVNLTQQTDVSCFGAADGSAEVTAAGGTPIYAYQWDDPAGQNSALATGLEPGTYSVEVTDMNGCTTIVNGIVVEEPDELLVTVSSTVPITCDEGADGVAETLVTGGTLPYTYSWDDPDGQSGSTATGLTEGQFTVTVTDANGCTDQVTATIDPPINVLVADFSMSPDSGLQPLDVTFFNNSEGGTAYEWFFGDGNTTTTFDTASFQYTYVDSGSFTITLVAYNDVTGCSDTLVLENGIYIEPTSLLTIPNVITPNGDGLNDIFPIDPTDHEFFPWEIRNIINFHGEIYNRWGEKVFEWTQPLGGWDGRTTSGLELEGGTYYYVITAKGIDGEPPYTDYEFKGNITLIR